MTTVDGSGTKAGLDLLLAGIHQAAVLAVRAAVDAAEESARGTTLFNDATGETRRSIRGEVDGLEGFVTAGGAAGFLENGTPPHRIPTSGYATLAFEVNGEKVFASWVDHPGTAERPFMAEAQKVGQQALEYGLEFFVDYALQKAR